jgi:hypothetical protein
LLTAGRLQEARGGDPEQHPSAEHQPRLAPAECLGIGQQLVGVGVPQVVADGLGPVSGLLGQSGSASTFALAKVLADTAEFFGHRRDLLADLGRALVDLSADDVLRLRGRALSSALDLFCGAAIRIPVEGPARFVEILLCHL